MINVRRSRSVSRSSLDASRQHEIGVNADFDLSLFEFVELSINAGPVRSDLKFFLDCLRFLEHLQEDVDQCLLARPVL